MNFSLTASPQPLPQLGKHLGPAEQVEVVGAVANPLPFRGERQRARRVLVAAQRAVQRHQAVAEQAVLQVAALRARGGGHGEAAQLVGQRHRLPALRSLPRRAKGAA